MTNSKRVISIPALARTVTEAWDVRDLVTAADSVLRVVRVEGVMDWHKHEEDQLFICWEGKFTIELEGAPPVELGRGDLYVIPRGVRHKTVAAGLAYALMSIGVHTMART